ncbi:HTH domain-containing protein [Vagococcus hydrophili]|uniref:HTH domain-containing protein n=1 Tax=Vagococcus hydrophili TaxID=2714947 RepID=A0A6G8AU07_9ENTE|nr:HTH domain-containing protein [Vagococcus hydrophili]QIL48558.1 HTH domain-containing protein [Vagococcus hydrophili]
MFPILDVSSQRLIKILTVLLHTDNWITIREISKQLSVSEKTIHDDLKYIQGNLSSMIEIESSFPYGIQASKMTSNVFLEIQSEILLNSISIKFILILLETPDKDLNYYSDELHISRSTLYRYLPTLTTYFEEYGLTIKKNSGKYNITANNEYLFRRFFTTFLYEIYGYNTKFIIPEDLSDILCLRLKNMYSQNGEEISDLQTEYYSLFYYLSLIRESKNHKIDYSNNFSGKNSLFSTEEQSYFESNYPQLSSNILMNIESNIYIHRHSMFDSTDTLFIKEVSRFLDKIYSTFHIKHHEFEKEMLIDFLVDLCINIKYLKIPYHFFSDRFSLFSNQIKKSNSMVYKLLVTSIHDLGNSTGLDFSLYEGHLIYLIVVSLPAMLQTQFNQPILIVSNYSVEHSQFLLRMLQGQLNMDPIYFEHVVCIQERNISNYDVSEFQLILTNVELKIDHPHCVLISDFPKAKSIREIKRILYDNRDNEKEE